MISPIYCVLVLCIYSVLTPQGMLTLPTQDQEGANGERVGQTGVRTDGSGVPLNNTDHRGCWR
jgi:hypothetical protein